MAAKRMKRRVIRYSDSDIRELLYGSERGTGMPMWERNAHLAAAARQRGYKGIQTNIHKLETYLDAMIS